MTPVLAPTDLVVEVLSVSNTAAEMQQKLREYFDSGSQLAWIIDPATRTVAVHHAPGQPTRVIASDGRLDGESVVPGFTMPVIELFRNVPAEG
jgi:Uma2 family endonuclease